MWKDEREILENQGWLDTELNIKNNTIAVSMLFFLPWGISPVRQGSSLSRIYDEIQTRHTR